MQLGWSNVDAMLRSMTARQFNEWVLFAELEPFGEPRADARTGILAQILANVYRDKAQHAAPYSIGEVIPQPPGDTFDRVAPKKQTWQEMKAIAMFYSGLDWGDD